MAQHHERPRGAKNEREFIGGRYGRGQAYGNPDNEYGVDSKAYGHYRRPEAELDPHNEGYAGRNAGDYTSRRYSDSYYYNPDHRERGWHSDAGAYDDRDFGDRDYERHYRKGGSQHNDNYSQRNEYYNTNTRGQGDFYGSYPSSGQSWADRDSDRNNYWHGNNYGSQNRFTNYGTNDAPDNWQQNQPGRDARTWPDNRERWY